MNHWPHVQAKLRMAILATSGMERRNLLIATAKLQLFQGISGIAAAAIKMWYGIAYP